MHCCLARSRAVRPGATTKFLQRRLTASFAQPQDRGEMFLDGVKRLFDAKPVERDADSGCCGGTSPAQVGRFLVATDGLCSQLVVFRLTAWARELMRLTPPPLSAGPWDERLLWRECRRWQCVRRCSFCWWQPHVAAERPAGEALVLSAVSVGAARARSRGPVQTTNKQRISGRPFAESQIYRRIPRASRGKTSRRRSSWRRALRLWQQQWRRTSSCSPSAAPRGPWPPPPPLLAVSVYSTSPTSWPTAPMTSCSQSRKARRRGILTLESATSPLPCTIYSRRPLSFSPLHLMFCHRTMFMFVLPASCVQSVCSAGTAGRCCRLSCFCYRSLSTSWHVERPCQFPPVQVLS